MAKDSTVTIHDVPIPALKASTEILVKVIASGVNPKDWKMQSGILTTISDCPNSGDDVAGIVEATGCDVKDFHKGDRVAGLHELGTRGGSFAEYAILNEWTTFHIPEHISFEQACTVPMASLMAAIGFFGLLKITAGPWASSADRKTPLVIYGASSAMGTTIIQYAKMVDVHPLICVVGNGIELAEKLLKPEKGDVVVDYRKGDDAVVQGIRSALKGEKLEYAFDAVSAHGSWINIGQVLDPHGKITLVLPGTREELSPTVEQTCTMAGSLWKDLKFQKSGVQGDLGLKVHGRKFGLIFSRLVGRWLGDGRLAIYPYRKEPGGLAGLEGALKSLRGNKTTGFKHVILIADTPGI